MAATSAPLACCTSFDAFLTPSRLVVAQPLGIRTVVISNVNATEFSAAELARHKETWLYYPDMGPGWDEKVGGCIVGGRLP